MSDADEIQDVVLRYCRGIDRLDLELVRSVYHPDGVDHHTGFDGGIDDYLTWVAAGLARFTGTMHIVGNHLAQIEGERAVAETYGTAVHWGEPADESGLNFTTGFRYIDRLERRDGTWAIVERWAVREWTRSDAGRRRAKEGDGPTGFRGERDPLYRALRTLSPEA